MFTINLPRNLMLSLLQDSEEFRVFAVDNLIPTVSPVEKTRNTVEKIIGSANDKITAIRNIREFWLENPRDFEDAYPYVEISVGNSGARYLSLVVAKRFVESFERFHPLSL